MTTQAFTAPYTKREWKEDYSYARKVRSGRHDPMNDGYRLGPRVRVAFRIAGLPEDYDY